MRERRGKNGKLETHYHYNAANQLVAVEKDGKRFEYRYDPFGRRIQKITPEATTNFLWNGDVLAWEEQDSNKTYYGYEPDSFRPLAQVRNGAIYHYHLDHLGTPREMTDAEGNLVWSVQYRAYGSLACQEVALVENNLRFQGQYFDQETGLHYNRFRYYDPSAGRFIHQDPIGLEGGVNLYEYVPNPTGWVDPNGLTAKPGDCPAPDSSGSNEQAQVIIGYKPGNPFGHNAIGINDGEETRWFDLVITDGDVDPVSLLKGGQGTKLREQSKLRPDFKTTSRDVSPQSAKAMLAKAREMQLNGTGGYSLLTNSCTTACRDIMAAGGIKPSWWARSPSLLLRGSGKG